MENKLNISLVFALTWEGGGLVHLLLNFQVFACSESLYASSHFL
jgi:hypothetical protein